MNLKICALPLLSWEIFDTNFENLQIFTCSKITLLTLFVYPTNYLLVADGTKLKNANFALQVLTSNN